MANIFRDHKYDDIIIILITSIAFGNFGGPFQLTRILSICLFPFLLLKIKRCFKYVKTYLSFYIFFIFYCFISLLWIPDKIEGVIEIIYNIIHFLIFLEILVFAKFSKTPLESISKGWTYAVILTLIVAIWEISTGNHLNLSSHVSDKIENLGDGIFISRTFASVTFYNYNTYVTFLCFSAPFIFYRLLLQNQIKYMFFPIVVLSLSFVCVLVNASRGGLLTFCLMILIYLYKKGNNLKYSLIFILILSFLVYFLNDALFIKILARSSNGGLFSGEGRFNIWNNVIKVLIDFLGLGTGVGNSLQYHMANYSNKILVPHNFFLEILVKYGLVIFVCFSLFLIKLYKMAFKTYDFNIRVSLYISLLPLPIYSIIDSCYTLNYFVFISFASLIVFSNYGQIKNIN